MLRRRIRDIRHDELVSATIAAIHARGFAQVTMAEIATRAGSTAASINYYFGTKEMLMEATMRHLLGILKAATLARLKTANTPYERLCAIIEANFDDSLYTAAQCSVWGQFWSHAPYSKPLARLQQINRVRVRSNMQAELKMLLPAKRQRPARQTLQAYMDGVWLNAAQQAPASLDAAAARTAAIDVLDALLGKSD